MNAVSQPVKPLRIAFVQSCWHRDIVDQCRDAFVARIVELGFDAGAVQRYEVPGAFELPLHAKLLAQRGEHDAVVAAGLVVDGGIYRHEFVAQAVINGLMQVQLDTLTPVFSAVLTPHHFQGSEEHVGFFREHMLVKGREVANACIETLERVALIA
jgi:6,7-dimethyl-8-ribityllumazine synthase